MSIAEGAIGDFKGIIHFSFIHTVPAKLPYFVTNGTSGSSYFTLGVTGKLKNNTGIISIFQGLSKAGIG